MFSQIKNRKHIEKNFHFVAGVMPQGWDLGLLKNFSVGICDGAPLIRFFLKFSMTTNQKPAEKNHKQWNATKKTFFSESLLFGLYEQIIYDRNILAKSWHHSKIFFF